MTMVGVAGTNRSLSSWSAVTSYVIVASVLAFGNAINDIFDLESDRVGKSNRPLPARRVTESGAWFAAFILALTAVLVTLLRAFRLSAFVASMIILAYAYSSRFKRIPFIGNISVAVLAGCTVLFGAEMAARELPSPVVLASGVVAMAVFCFETAKTVEDREDDARAGHRTMAHVIPRELHPRLILVVTLLYLLVSNLCISFIQGSSSSRALAMAAASIPAVPLLALGSEPASRVRLVRAIHQSKWLFPLTVVALLHFV
jgi:4-hydroxybenzoate polyprenyltransferase